ALGAAATVSFRIGPARASDIVATRLNGGETALSPNDIAKFDAALKGDVLTATSAEYDAARKIWNAMFDRRPALIARPTDAEDVATAVKFARDHDLLTAVRCGGHSISGQSVCEGGLVIDLSRMRRSEVDATARTARLDGGCLLADLDRNAQAVGLASTAGVVSHTGAAGLTLGGGMGRLQRQFGLAVDNVLGVEIVTADGRKLVANANENPDLYWGVRGGGGNFGVVTSITYRLHPFDHEIVTASFAYPIADAKTVLAHYFENGPQAPDELWITAGLSTNQAGEQRVSLGGSYMGNPVNAEAALRKIGVVGKPANERFSRADYVALQSSIDAATAFGKYHYAKAGMLGETGPELIERMLGYFTERPLPGASVSLLVMGGAVNRVGVSDTAYPHRTAQHNIDVGGASADPKVADGYVTWGRAFWTEIEPLTNGGFYVNQMMQEADSKVRANYGPNYDRLVALKTKYDPMNLFRLNANIKPNAA
ncbi:MAG: FAD-binding oxidoreductase, partial [Rhodospirillaceae bacterium]|nr:FAD-binding oxidoreductase [Rhodospirillaceae bacterium]